MAFERTGLGDSTTVRTLPQLEFDALPQAERAKRFADNVGGWAEKMPGLAAYLEAK